MKQRSHQAKLEDALVQSAVAAERERCIRVLKKHVKCQSNDRCCDNCHCQGVRRTLEELQR
jgi:3'-phosphoadenosine 5'-phosphosulfate sulfotransferase (PAPS reductase)/FAD synthetase